MMLVSCLYVHYKNENITPNQHPLPPLHPTMRVTQSHINVLLTLRQ